MNPLLQLEGVSLRYQTAEAETVAIERLDLSVAPGEFVAIVGPSGCGKSTVLSMIAGLLPPTAGSITLNGKAVDRPLPGIGYMLQRDHLFEWRSIWENVALGLDVRKQPGGRERAESLLKTYGLYEFKDSRPSELSGGMRQRAALLRTLAIDPDLLLLDEPFSALDYQTRLTLSDEVSAIIRKEQKTALFVTHDISEAVSIADRVVVFSARPARVTLDLPVTLPGSTPLSRRSAEEFRAYFDRIWKELQHHA